jgi:hypothetical protein
VVLLYRWSFCTGGPSIQVVTIGRWSFYTGGPSVQVVLLYRWSLSAGGPSIQVVLLYRWFHCSRKNGIFMYDQAMSLKRYDFVESVVATVCTQASAAWNVCVT